MLVYDGRCEVNHGLFSHVQKSLGDGASLQYTPVQFEVAEHPLSLRDSRTRYERERILGLWSKLPHSPEHHRSESFGGRLQNGQSLLCIVTSTYETVLIELWLKIAFRMCSKRG